MTNKIHDEVQTEAAITWFVTLQDCDDEEVWILHRDWLEADPANSAAFALVEASWIAIENPDCQGAFATDRDVAKEEGTIQIVDIADARDAGVVRGKGWVWAPFTAAAASVAAILSWSSFIQPTSAPGTSYSTDAKHVRAIALADGSLVTLNHDTTMVAHVDGKRRAITLTAGEAAFDVRHDAARPFSIKVAGREVRVLGTAFGVTARSGEFGVSVSRGAVSVSAAGDPDRIIILPAGKALSRLRGTTHDQIADVAPANAFPWKTGELVYTAATLAAVARDYERMIGQPVVVDPSILNLPIAGVLHARDEDELVRQIALILPVKVVHTPTGRRIMPKSVN